MAITTNFSNVEKKFNDKYWDSIDEFEDYYLRRIQETIPNTNYYTGRDGVEIKINPITHHPELKEYEVWVAGYAATGESSTATLLGKAFARNFAQACDIVMCKDHLKYIEEVNSPDYKGYCPPSKWSYDTTNLTSWGRSLFWSEKLARKTFG